MSMRNPNGFIRPGYDPLQVADAPTAVTPTAGNQSASVNFTAPTDVGGAAVSEYYAVVQPGNITATSVTPPVAVSGLTNGTEYTTKVWANNSYGPSPYSAESSGFTPTPPYVEDVFSTYLYTGNSTARDIQNDINLSGEGGMVWIKWRSGGQGYGNHELYDTNRGATKAIESSSANGETTRSSGLTAFNSDGFSLDTSAYENGDGNFASWTFRKAEKFFDVVTYTGNDVSGRGISHNLGSVPGFIMIKNLSGPYADSSNWAVYHRSLGATQQNRLFSPNALLHHCIHCF